PDGPQVQVVGLEVPEVPLDVLEAFVCGHDRAGTQLGGGDGGAQHVEAVQGRLGVDLVLPAGDGQGGVGDGDGEVLAGLVLADHLAGLDADLVLPGQPPRIDAGDEGLEELPGGAGQLLAGAGAVFGQRWVAAGDQPLTGVVRVADLGQVLLVEQ